VDGGVVVQARDGFPVLRKGDRLDEGIDEPFGRFGQLRVFAGTVAHADGAVIKVHAPVRGDPLHLALPRADLVERRERGHRLGCGGPEVLAASVMVTVAGNGGGLCICSRKRFAAASAIGAVCWCTVCTATRLMSVPTASASFCWKSVWLELFNSQ